MEINKDRFDKIKQIFDEYSEKIKKYKVDQYNQLKLYGLYKQANFGDNMTPKPGFFDFKELAKWNAWKDYFGESKYTAMKKYILIVRELI